MRHSPIKPAEATAAFDLVLAGGGGDSVDADMRVSDLIGSAPSAVARWRGTNDHVITYSYMAGRAGKQSTSVLKEELVSHAERFAINRTKVFKLAFRDGRGFVTCTCSTCGGSDSASMAHNVPPEGAARTFRRMGWDADNEGGSAKCPACKTGKKSHAPPQSTDALKQQRVVYKLLEEHFDEDSGEYDDGWNDERVAKESRVSLDRIVTLRETSFGPLRDAEGDKLLADLAELRATITRDYTNMLNGTAEFAKKIEERIVAMERRINEFMMRKRGAA